MRFYLQLICLVFFLPSLGFGQSVPTFPIGEYWQFPDARSLGLAGAGSMSQHSIGALMMNPAALGGDDRGFQVQFSNSARSLEERRAFPVFDRFDDISSLGVYALNNNWFTGFQGGISYNFGEGFLKSVGIGSFSEIDQNYLYEEEVRSNIFGDALLAYNRIEFDGKLQRYALGAAFNVAKNLDLGVQVGLLNGNLAQSASTIFVENSNNDFMTSTDYEMDGRPLVASFGATYQATSHLGFASHLRLPYEVKYLVSNALLESSTARNATVEYPMQLNVGLEYRGQQELRARLHIDFSYEWWSKTGSDSLLLSGANTAGTLDDAATVKIGIEHLILEQVPFLAGIQYRTSFLDRRQTRTLFTVGSGFQGRNWVVNVSGGFSKLTYRFEDLFDDAIFGGDRSNRNIDDVDERYFFGLLTLNVNLK